MTNGSHIRAVDEEGAQGEPQSEETELLTLEEEWEDTGEEEVYEPRRSLRWLPPALAILAVSVWTGFFGWAHAPAMRAASPAQWSEWIVSWSIPVILVLAVWLLVMRMSRREAARFADAAAALSEESERLENRLVTVNRELSLAREFLGAQSRELDSLGRLAARRLSEHADTLQSLIRDNGEQVNAIGSVSATALENMTRLRDDLPVIANSARDVSNQIGNAGRTAQEQLDELVSGFTRLNEFGQASERQVSSLRTRVDEALAAFEAQAAQLDDVAAARFATLREKSEEFRADLDGREVEALAAMRNRAERLREELAKAQDELETQEGECLTSLHARISALREGAGNVGRSLAETESRALEGWKAQVASLKQDLSEAIAEVERIDAAALESANRRLQALREEAEQVDAQLAERNRLFEEEIARRREDAAAAQEQAIEDHGARLAQLDQALEERRLAQIERSRELAREGEAIAAGVAAMVEKTSQFADQAGESERILARAVEALDEKLSSSRAVIAESESAIGRLTEGSVRLLELIQAGARHSREDLPAAIEDAEGRLKLVGEETERLSATLLGARDTGRELADYVLKANETGREAMNATEVFHTRFAELSGGNAAELEKLRDTLGDLLERSEAYSTRVREELQESITLLEQAANEALAQLENASEERVHALAHRIGEDTAEAVDRAVRTRSAEAIGQLEQAAAHASGVGREAAVQLRDQLAKVNELAGNLETRVARARERAEEQVNNDFSRRVALLTESLNSNAVDISQAMSAEISDTAWAAYLRGDRGIFTRRAVQLLDSSEAREIHDIYQEDPGFRENVNRYIHDFEAMLRTMLSTRDGNALGVTLLSSDMGKLYVALAQAIERLRN